MFQAVILVFVINFREVRKESLKGLRLIIRHVLVAFELTNANKEQETEEQFHFCMQIFLPPAHKQPTLIHAASHFAWRE